MLNPVLLKNSLLLWFGSLGSMGLMANNDLRLKRRLRTRLQGALWGEDVHQDCDAVIVSYWWD
ncbi:MAG: hypothetical protein V7K48_12590 [Nostoc sp.]|uniref:hypothetical protein n=1 Tax=Nostoc sp. TaxID=1180 RepID=UPI002FFBF845